LRWFERRIGAGTRGEMRLSTRMRARARRRATALVHHDSVRAQVLRGAVEVLESSYGTLELARTLIDLGAAVRLTGAVTDARARLARGQELAMSCGASPWSSARARSCAPQAPADV
jgi:hypothetical protein